MYIAPDLKRILVPCHLKYATGDDDEDDETVKLSSAWIVSGER